MHATTGVGVRGLRAVAALLLLLAALTLTGCGVIQQAGKKTADSSAGQTVAPGYDGSGDAMSVLPPEARDVPHGTATTMEEYSLNSADAIAPAPGGSGEDASTVPPEDRLVIRTVDMRMRVEDVDESASAVRSAAEKRKGMVVDFQVSTDEGVPVYRPYVEGSALTDGAALSGYITVRVPAEELEAFIDEVTGLGEVLRQAENESDVTQEHIDLAARLKNLEATETRLREFFEKAKNVTEMLSIEQELSRVRGEIESLKAQMAYLERQAAMSTVTVELTGPTPVVRPEGENWGFVDALTQSVRAFVGTINAIIVIAGGLAPIVIIGLVVFLPTRAWFRRRAKARALDGATAAGLATATDAATTTDTAGQPENDVR